MPVYSDSLEIINHVSGGTARRNILHQLYDCDIITSICRIPFVGVYMFEFFESAIKGTLISHISSWASILIIWLVFRICIHVEMLTTMHRYFQVNLT